MEIQQISKNRCFGGQQMRYRHFSEVLACEMHFSIFLPPAPRALPDTTFPLLYWLSGLTCTDENFVQKAGVQKIAAELGLIIVAPDTSPRGDAVPDDPDGAYDFGLGAGFYLNASEAPWAKHYQMYDYISLELPEIIREHFPVTSGAESIFGHSMGGHGALTIALKNPDQYKSVSAFAPICSPPNCPWGQKALTQYLGDNQQDWQQYDACALITQSKQQIPMLVDQGDADDFLEEQLKPELLRNASKKANYPLQYNLRPGYDHSFFFIASFIGAHLRFHHAALS